MFEDKKDDTFLSRWINNELSDAALEDFKNHPDYPHYQKIKQAGKSLALKDYDSTTALNTLKTKLKNAPHNPQRTSVIRLLPYMAVAASIALLIGLFLLGSTTTTLHADYGQQLSVMLPDGSEMTINTNTTASYSKKNWDKNREVILDGEAYFKVKKGSTFQVKTNNGTVSVLGTQFNVNAVSKLFEVICYEGKVAVKTATTKRILTPEHGFLQIDANEPVDFTAVQTAPNWLSKTSVFRSIPFEYVLVELKKQYDITIDITAIADQDIQDMRYTGSFPHDHLDIALRTVFSTLGLQYSIAEDGTTVIVSH